MNKAVFLDRDGTINELVLRDGKLVSPRNCSDFRVLDGVADAIVKLKSYNYAVIVVTNQPDIAKKMLSFFELSKMHEILKSRLPITDIIFCPHQESDGCICRKPNPGMLFEAASKHRISLKDSFMVGDRVSDVIAGKSAGCKSLLLSNETQKVVDCEGKFSTLVAATDWIINNA